jgi:hypothetical protein
MYALIKSTFHRDIVRMQFHFQLVPLAEVAPWGEKRKSLHWFGLTDGYFWVDVAGQELFRYSQAVLNHWQQCYPAERDLPYTNYNIARYWEDLLEMLPAVLDPVPDDLAQRVVDQDAWSAWQERATTWMESQDSDAAWDTYYMAHGWWDACKWSTMHWSEPL